MLYSDIMLFNAYFKTEQKVSKLSKVFYIPLLNWATGVEREKNVGAGLAKTHFLKFWFLGFCWGFDGFFVGISSA